MIRGLVRDHGLIRPVAHLGTQRKVEPVREDRDTVPEVGSV